MSIFYKFILLIFHFQDTRANFSTGGFMVAVFFGVAMVRNTRVGFRVEKSGV